MIYTVGGIKGGSGKTTRCNQPDCVAQLTGERCVTR